MKCFDCPVKCGADRELGVGACKSPNDFVIAHADLHFWEEPCISGKTGTGAIFFSGCNLNCVFCQNDVTSHTGNGSRVDRAELKEILLALQQKGACTVSFVTPSHYARQLSEFLKEVKPFLKVPVVYNSGGYDDVESLKLLDGLVDVYLPDFKYADRLLSKRYGAREDYPTVAFDALKEMLRQQPKTIFDKYGVVKKGVIVRHLVLPDCLDNTKEVLKILAKINKNLYVSLMAQYLPMAKASEFENLCRSLTQEEYDQAVEYFFDAGLKNGFSQEISSAEECFVPEFNRL